MPRGLKISTLIVVLLSCVSVLMGSNNLYAQESAESAHQKGMSYLEQNKLDEAIGEFSKELELNPRSDSAYYNRGRAYNAKGDIDKALADYTSAINIDSGETIQGAYINRGLIYENKGDLDKALEDYTKGIEAMPNPTYSLFRYAKQKLLRNRAGIYLQKREYDKAWADVRSIEKMGGKVGPEFITKLTNRDSTSDKKDTEKTPEKYPGAASEVNFFSNRGYDSYEARQYNAAIVDYNRALEIDPNAPQALANRAMAYAAKGDFDKAIADYTKILEVDPQDFKIYHDLGLTYISKGDFDKAIDSFNKALEINPDLINDGQFHNDRAIPYFRKKEYDACWEDVNKAMELGYHVHPQFLRALKKATGRVK